MNTYVSSTVPAWSVVENKLMKCWQWSAWSLGAGENGTARTREEAVERARSAFKRLGHHD